MFLSQRRQACPEPSRRDAKLGMVVISTPWSNGPQLHGEESFLRSLAFARDDGPLPVTFAPWRPFDFTQDMLCERYSEFLFYVLCVRYTETDRHAARRL